MDEHAVMDAELDIAPKGDMTDESATFGDRLSFARENAGIKRKAVAHQLGVKTSTLRSWEEDRSEPRANRLTLLAGMLGVSLIWLMTGHGAGPEHGAEIGADDTPGRAVRFAALRSDFASARADLTAVNRRLAGIEGRMKRLLAESDV